jgi:hypothetical protein
MLIIPRNVVHCIRWQKDRAHWDDRTCALFLDLVTK